MYCTLSRDRALQHVHLGGECPYRRIPLLGITHPAVGKHFQVLEVHPEVDTSKVLVIKKARFWLCYVFCKILDSLFSFCICNEKEL